MGNGRVLLKFVCSAFHGKISFLFLLNNLAKISSQKVVEMDSHSSKSLLKPSGLSVKPCTQWCALQHIGTGLGRRRTRLHL